MHASAVNMVERVQLLCVVPVVCRWCGSCTESAECVDSADCVDGADSTNGVNSVDGADCVDRKIARAINGRPNYITLHTNRGGNTGPNLRGRCQFHFSNSGRKNIKCYWS